MSADMRQLQGILLTYGESTESKETEKQARAASLKRHLTSGSEIIEINEENQTNTDGENFRKQINNRNIQSTNRNNNDTDYRFPVNKTNTNSNINENRIRHQQQQRNDLNINNSNTKQQRPTSTDQSSIQISSPALNYTTEHHLPPLKMECNLKLKDQKQG
ncbi:unnamed protein product [Didymodactylos carnosus]|uniref:Uncharacterized protein n=1 Tax=Didymodactylos carnosus TaxID=1234261 RepID=A0A815CEG0_9BILA|nr:unnamed protein product [Didymodactylos carnosus]CAF1279283.1 unnamed protein product [Didymodactylos carnosus]CAF3976734.1 unnamed protein product [Didymodactylos carnosus]CAF4073228.1 unnamed protein product [Didymodactylos carnosus]